MSSIEYKEYSEQVLEAIREAEQRALLATGILAKAKAVLLAPVAEVAGGNLRQSIDYDVGNKKVFVGSFSRYAIYVEKGTGIYAEDMNGRLTPWVYFDQKTQTYYWTRGQKPQPFIFPSVMQYQQEIISIFEEELSKLE